MWTGSRTRWRFVYLSVFLVQLRVLLLRSGEIVLGLLELGFPNLDLLVLPGHLQQGFHLVGTEQGSEVNVKEVPIPAFLYDFISCIGLILFFFPFYNILFLLTSFFLYF